jgi:hypothetical protein
MKLAKQIKAELIEVLSVRADELLKQDDFVRTKKSFVYKGALEQGEQWLTIGAHSNPRYCPGAEVHIYPSLQVLMPQVSDEALRLLGGDKFLLGNAPECLIGQPLDFFAPKDSRVQWYASGKDQMLSACDGVVAFFRRWGLPFLSRACSPSDLVRLYERPDPYIGRSEYWYTYITAAYRILGEEEKAREVVRKHFSPLWIKKRYGVLFRSLGME